MSADDDLRKLLIDTAGKLRAAQTRSLAINFADVIGALAYAEAVCRSVAAVAQLRRSKVDRPRDPATGRFVQRPHLSEAS